MSNDQKNIDKVLLELDGSENKKNLGANSILSSIISKFKMLGALCK